MIPDDLLVMIESRIKEHRGYIKLNLTVPYNAVFVIYYDLLSKQIMHYVENTTFPSSITRCSNNHVYIHALLDEVLTFE